MRARTSSPTARVESNTPIGSMPGLIEASRDSRTNRNNAITTMPQTGKLIPKAHRQEYWVVSAPPISGPSAAMAPIVDPQIANAVER